MTRIVLKIGSMLAAADWFWRSRPPRHSNRPQTGGSAGGAADPQIGRSFQVPYRLTETNHFLVRVRLNGKGPFNFLVDSGAPALYVATETAKKIGLKPDPAEFWTPIDRLDLEGGARLEGVKARVEDPFQLVGMNALGLPGASIDGILGFTILARFRLEIDLTQDRMTWTRLAHEPRDPPVPKRARGENPARTAGRPGDEQPGVIRQGAGALRRQAAGGRAARAGLPRAGVDRAGRSGTAPRSKSVVCWPARRRRPAGFKPETGSSRSTAARSTASKGARAALSRRSPATWSRLLVRRDSGTSPSRPGA